MPAPPHLDHHPPGALAAASAQESPSPASPRLCGAAHAGCTPLKTPGLGAQGVGYKDRTSEQVLHVNQAEKVIPILFPGYFDIVPRNHVVPLKRDKMRCPTVSCYMEFHLPGSSSLYLIWEI